MTETVGRRISTRNRGEPPLKKRAVTPSPPRPPRAQPPPAPSEAKVEDGLPIKLKDGQPLPVLTEPQDRDLSTKAFQSISESGVLAASIDQSRRKWISEGIFERYWSKPSKKKPVGETPNPSKESMSRLGPCSMIIEPHAFEITFYTVKSIATTVQPPKLQPPPQTNGYYNPFPQRYPYAPPSYNAPYAGSPNHSNTSSHNTLPSFGEAFGQFSAQGAPPAPHPPAAPAPPVTPSAPPSLSRASSDQEPSKDGAPNTDPVIQMLATRAASDHALKALMKVVASGKASPEQLKDFQKHIDELNTILKSRGGLDPPNQDSETHKSSAPESEIFSAHTQVAAQSSSPHMPTSSSVKSFDATPNPVKAEISVPQYSQMYRHQPQPHIPPTNTKSFNTKPDIHSIVFDFGGSGDRFTFPRFSILEYLPGGTQVVVSFLITRRGSAEMAGKYKETRTYYQPITMRLSAQNSRTLEPLARIVAPPDEVRKYMDSVFDKMTPAETSYLPLRLPRAKELENNAEREKTPPKPLVPIIKRFYSPPNSLVPLAA